MLTLILVAAVAVASPDIAIDRLDICTEEDVRMLEFELTGPQARARAEEENLSTPTLESFSGSRLQSEILLQRAKIATPTEPSIRLPEGAPPR